MAALRKRSTIVPIAIGFGLYHVAKMPAAFGDLARAQANAAGALQFHLLALAIDLGGLACFAWAIWNLLRHFRGGGPPPVARPTTAPEGAEQSFDADAVMARYIANRGAVPPAPRGFGRKGM